jgi:small conductance mechanosensitive channel
LPPFHGTRQVIDTMPISANNSIMTSRLLPKLFLLLTLLLAAPAIAQDAPQSLPPEKPVNTLPTAADLGKQFERMLLGKPAAAQPHAATPQAAAPVDAADVPAEGEPQETFGTRALGFMMIFVDVAREQIRVFLNNAAAFPQVNQWFSQQLAEPNATRWQQIGQLMLLSIGTAFLIGVLLDLLLYPVRTRILARHPATYAGRFGSLTLWFSTALAPVVLFLAAALFILDYSEPSRPVRLIVLSIIYALTLHGIVRLLSRFILAPRASHLRLVPMSDTQACYVQRWVALLSFVIIYGYFLADVARIVRMPLAGVSFFKGILGLIIVGMTITIITEKRAYVSAALRGNLSAARRDLTALQSLRLWFARSWHALAIAYLVIGYIVTTASADEGFGLMVRGTIGTLLCLLLLQLTLHAIRKFGQRHATESPQVTSRIYVPVLKFLFRLGTWALAAAGILTAWSVDVGALTASAWGQRVLGSAFSIGTTVLAVVFCYELLQGFIESRLHQKDANGNVVEVNSRARTLLPMIRNAAMVILAVIVALVTLSELGVNIAPLLAGAGIIGVAVGFGSQTLIKDFLTGLFIILEDTIAVGDVVGIGDKGGAVEGMTLRTVRLRDVDGALHIVPFSEIATVTNRTKGFAFALMDMSVGYDSDIDQVVGIMKAVGAELQLEEKYGPSILEPIDVFGVERFADSAIVIRGRIKTKPGKQWEIKRAYYQRIKQRFDAEGIEIPYPTTVTKMQSSAQMDVPVSQTNS